MDLYKACIAGDFRYVSNYFITRSGARYNINHAFRLACQYGNEKIIWLLIANGADIHLDNDRALSYASADGFFGLVKYLVTHGANIHAGGGIALRDACQHKRANIFKYLVENGAEVKVLPSNDIWDEAIIMYLIENNMYDMTLLRVLLIRACGMNYFEVVKHIIEKKQGDRLDLRGAAITVYFNRHYHILMYLIKYGANFTNIVQKLLQHTQNINGTLENMLYLLKKYWCRWRRFMVMRWAKRLLRVWYRPDMLGGIAAKRVIAEI